MKNVLWNLCLVLFISSCAQTQVVVSSSEVRPYKEFQNKDVKFSTEAQVNLFNFEDLREVKQDTLLGEAKTGLESLETPLLLDQSVQQFLTQFYRKELALRGVQFDFSRGADLDLKLERLWIYEENGFQEKAVCELILNYQLKRANATRKGKVNVKVSSGQDYADATSKLSETLGACLHRSIDKLAESKIFKGLLKTIKSSTR